MRPKESRGASVGPAKKAAVQGLTRRKSLPLVDYSDAPFPGGWLCCSSFLVFQSLLEDWEGRPKICTRRNSKRGSLGIKVPGGHPMSDGFVLYRQQEGIRCNLRRPYITWF